MAEADINPRLTPDLERTLRRYVMGGVEENLRAELEELLITDPDVFEALGVVEDELIEEYLDGALPDADRAAFEQHFLTSPQRATRLRIARTLRERASSPRPQPVSGGGVARWQRAWMGLAAALALSLAGNAWLASRSMQLRPPAVSELGRDTRGNAATFTLATGLLRGGGSLTRVSVPDDAEVVRLRLDLPTADVYPAYRATMLDDEGNEVWTAAKLRVDKGDPSVVVVAIPAEILPRGDYQVRLSGQGEAGEPMVVGTYTFRVSDR